MRVLKQEAEEEKAETARLSSFVGAIAVGDLVKTTLGPKGMDKILVSLGRNEGKVIRILQQYVIYLDCKKEYVIELVFLLLLFFLRIFQVEITNDGATILKSIGVDNPAAKILVDMSRVQDDEVGDGTTSVTVFGKSLILLVLLIIENI